MSEQPVVSLFIQCLVDTIYPHVGEAMITVFNRLDVPVDYPQGQTCCGQPAFNSGYRREATEAAKRFITLFEDAEVIVCPSGSCVNMVRHHYLELFQEDQEWLKRATAIAKKTFEFTEYIVDQIGVSSVAAHFPYKVTYHDSCHLSRGLGIKSQPRTLLSHTSLLEFIEMEDSDTCCGFGGTFSINYPDISIAMVDEKIENIIASGAEVVTGCDISCLMNIEGRLSRLGTNVRVMHIAEILAEQQGGEL